MPAGAVAGVLAAAVIGALIYQGGMRLNLAKFFRWTGAFLIIVAAGLLAGSLRGLHEAGIWNALQDIVFDPSNICTKTVRWVCCSADFRLYRPSGAGRGLGLAAVPYSRHDLVFARQQAV
ncbi:putative integral membrane protein [Neisseria gonorrhoeae]|uniref:Putative integral membrane protein n=1 Tax=Neisseria gonorrhoeae TaxID=485 RepID=A0A378W312_NEIGO|nr:putative integral membrane protein [Neisseria gonorrhoeae]